MALCSIGTITLETLTFIRKLPGFGTICKHCHRSCMRDAKKKTVIELFCETCYALLRFFIRRICNNEAQIQHRRNSALGLQTPDFVWWFLFANLHKKRANICWTPLPLKWKFSPLFLPYFGDGFCPKSRHIEPPLGFETPIFFSFLDVSEHLECFRGKNFFWYFWKNLNKKSFRDLT